MSLRQSYGLPPEPLGRGAVSGREGRRAGLMRDVSRLHDARDTLPAAAVGRVDGLVRWGLGLE